MSFIINPYRFASTPSFTNDKSLLFDGVDEYLDLGTPASLAITGAFSFSCWVKTTATIFNTIICKGTNIATSDYYIRKSNTGIVFFQINGSAVNSASSTGTIDDGNWHHVACVYVPSVSMKIYIDGVEDGSDTTAIPSSLNNIYSGVTIGSIQAVANRFWGGNIDEPAIFDVALSTSQITTMYNSGVPTDISGMSNLVSHWRMGDDDTYPTISDVVGVVDGTMTNMESGDIVSDTP